MKKTSSTENVVDEIETLKQADSAFSWKHLVPILLSICALFISIRQSLATSEGVAISAYNGGLSPVIELDKAYLLNSDLRPYFYENKHLEDNDPNRVRVLSLAEMSLDCFELLLAEEKDHPDRFATTQRAEDLAWVADALRNSEVLRVYLNSHQAWYSEQLRTLNR